MTLSQGIKQRFARGSEAEISIRSRNTPPLERSTTPSAGERYLRCSVFRSGCLLRFESSVASPRLAGAD
jgi:hypothetical protein